jgi:GNAT superfamily N-acetyltransferase
MRRHLMEQKAGIVVRVVRPADAAMLQHNCFVMNTIEETAARIDENLQGYAEGGVIPMVAEVEGVVVGSAVLKRKNHPLYRHRADLGDMVVCGEHQRRGIARRLIEALHDRAAEIGVTIFETSVRGGTPAEEVYRRVGFREYGRLPDGLVETWGDHGVYDEVLLWIPVTRPVKRHQRTD